MMTENETPLGTITVSFCNQLYPAYLGGYQADMVTRTAMALDDPDSLKRNVSNHLPIVENSDVIEQTVRHYNHAVLKLMAGDWAAAAGVATKRDEIQAMDIEATAKNAMTNLTFIQKQPLCSIWGDALVLVNDHYYWLSINKCDHTTTAQMILDAVRIAFTALKLGTPEALVKVNGIPKADVDKARADAHQNRPPTKSMTNGNTSKRIDTSHVADAPAESGTRKSDNSDEQNKALIDYTQALARLDHLKDIGDTKATIELGEWSNDMLDQYGKSFTGYRIGVNITQITYEAAKNGKMLWNFYSTWKGKPSQQPMFSCSVWEDSPYPPSEAVLHILHQAKDAPVAGNYRAVFRVTRKQNKEGIPTNYFNLIKITLIDDTPAEPDEPIDMTPAQPKGKPAQTTLPGTPPPTSNIDF